MRPTVLDSAVTHIVPPLTSWGGGADTSIAMALRELHSLPLMPGDSSTIHLRPETRVSPPGSPGWAAGIGNVYSFSST